MNDLSLEELAELTPAERARYYADRASYLADQATRSARKAVALSIVSAVLAVLVVAANIISQLLG